MTLDGNNRKECAKDNIDLGRHMNDHMVSFYVANPSQFAIEYGWGGRTIDESCWQVWRYDSVESIWDHPELTELRPRWHADRGLFFAKSSSDPLGSIRA
jgi:hypothetical protein